MKFELNDQLLRFLQYKFPNDCKLIDTAMYIINSSLSQKMLNICGFFDSGKTRVLMIIKLILEFHNVHVVATTVLNAHANSINFRTLHAQFNIDWNTMKPSLLDRLLRDTHSYILIDDALLATPTLYDNLDIFLRQKLNCEEPWGGLHVIITTTSINGFPWLINNKQCPYLGIDDMDSSITPIITNRWDQAFHKIHLKTGSIRAININECAQSILNKKVQLIPKPSLLSSVLVPFSPKKLKLFGQTVHTSPTDIKKGCVQINFGLIITWNCARVKHFNTLCHSVLTQKTKEYLLPAKRRPEINKFKPKLKRTFISITNKAHSSNAEYDNNINDLTVLDICEDDAIIITQNIPLLRKGIFGRYKHPYKIQTQDNVIYPLEQVNISHYGYQYKIYPIKLAYAVTIAKVMGEKFHNIQIDTCTELSGQDLCAAISRNQHIQNINFIIDDKHAI